MGVDIYTSSGILFELEDAVNRFFKGIPNSKVKKIVSDIETLVDDESAHRTALKSVETCADLRIWFCEYANSGVEEDYVQNSEILRSIWDKILNHTAFSKLPEVDFEYFTSNRYSGYGVPLETICVVFDDNGLFETKPTRKGRSVAKAMKIKDIKQTIWTVYSY